MKKFKEVLERAIFLVIGVIIALVLLGGRGPETTFASPQPQGLVEWVFVCYDGKKFDPVSDNLVCASDEVLLVMWPATQLQEVLNRLMATEEVIGPMDARLTTLEGAVVEMWEGWNVIFSGAALEPDGLVDGIIGPMD